MRWLKWLVRAAVGLALAAAVGVGWLLGTESGLRWALAQAAKFGAARVELEGPRGALIRTISFERVAFQGSEARGVAFEFNLLALLADTISVEFLRIDSLRLVRPQPSTEQSTPLPFRIRVADAQVKSLVFEGYEIHDLQADYSGGASGHEAQASFSAVGARARLKASLQEEKISIEAEVQALNLAVIDPRLPQTTLQALLNARGTTSALAGTAAVVNSDPGPIDRKRLPFTRVETGFSTDLKKIDLTGMKAALHPAGSIQGKGSASLDGARFDIRVAALDLRALYSSLRATRLAGALELDLAPERQRVKGALAQEDMSLEADAERKDDDVEVRALRARAGDSEATGSGRIHLGEPLRFAADLKLARFNPARFGDYPEGSINGSLQAKGDLGGKGSARWQIANSRLFDQALASQGAASLAGERIQNADAWLTLGQNRATAKGAFGGPRDRAEWTLHVPDLAALAPAFGGEIRARGTAGGTWKQPSVVIDAQATKLRLAEALVFQRASVKASGTLEKHEGDLTAVNDEFDLKATLRGGWRGDAWRGEIASLSNGGEYPLELKTPAALEAGAQRVVLAQFEAMLPAGGRAAVESVRWEGKRLTSRGSISAMPAQWILTALHVDKLSGDLLLEGDWDLAATPKLNGRLAVRRASGDLAFGETPMELSAAAVEATLTEDRVAAKAAIASRLASARLEGTLAAPTRDAALAATAELEAAELRSLTEPLWTQARVSGRLGASLKATGTLSAPLLSGTLRGDALGVEMPPWGIALRDGRVRAELDANRLRVTEARIAGGDGSFSASGTLPLARDGAAATLEWQATQFRILSRPDRRLIVSGKGRTTFDGKRFGLNGELGADSGHFELAGDLLPTLDDDVEVVGQKPEDIRVAARKQGPLPLDLDLRLDLGNRLTVRAFGFNGGVTGKLRVATNPAGELIAQGRVEAVRARFRAYGQELEVDPGILVFDGPINAPGLDISAWRRHQQVEAG
ncbi:MAG TPA: translocation/assembly module TamB domain-containing protein, partial [Burkholderiales bacterium]|nr:translocation/assembly module TamB domain-containing protein [Burkholderiales bacterium]